MSTRASVIVPAHNEESLISDFIRRIETQDPEGLLEIIVVANGCDDATAERAAQTSARTMVLELDQGSKIAALNAGDAVATQSVRLYVDADVIVDGSALLALARAVDTAEARVASPAFHVDTRRSSWLVRQHYRMWELSDYRRIGHIGSGIYALSPSGRERFGDFPNVIADDRFVQQLFLPHERITVREFGFTVEAPRTFSAHLHRSTRIAAGNLELPERLQRASQPGAETRFGSLLKRALRRPSLWPALPVYAVGYVVPRVRARRLIARGKAVGWNRDTTTRPGSA